MDLTDDINDGTIDDDVATYVGRDMYVASRPEGDGPYDLSNWYAQNADSLYASFAAEAEGLTVVRGKLALNQRGSSWSGAGFRMGAAGFGSGLRPRTGDVALAVGGLDSNITSMQSKEATDAQASVSAWVHGAWLGNGIGIQGEQTDDLAFGAQLAGAGTWRAFNYNIPSVSLNAPSEPPYKTVDSWWNQSLPLVVAQHTTIDGDETRTVDYGTYTAKLQHGSQTLAERKGHGRTVAESSDAGWWVSDAPDDPAYVRTKYDNGSISHTFTFDEGHRERLITFRGDGESYWQVFEIPAEQLHSNGYAGLDFAFKDIPQDAVVVINVT
ncbi:MAG: choice-of-anchor A family protein, partial [Bifidobacterium castoris]|nr:choice-of-anchor A family protein [Bifidobacterium castoris]